MIETFVGRKTGIANRATTVAAYLKGIFASANPAENEIINCKIKIPNEKYSDLIQEQREVLRV